METFKIQNLTFAYPNAEKPILKNLNLSVNQGEFLVICGSSGCGKSTFLRHLKPCISPHGEKTGEIFFNGNEISKLSFQDEAKEIGFVLQIPDNQIVTNKVWHELAFGLESLGMDSGTIRRRVGEMAAFFGISSWFHADVSSLSGGQKQLLNLAAIMVMHPSVLILDEPTSQLDPIAAAEFFATLSKINRELGTTIILSEHRLEEVLPFAHRLAVIDEGAVFALGSVQEVGEILKNAKHPLFKALPAPMQLWSMVESQMPCPITPLEGRVFLEDYLQNSPINYQWNDEVFSKNRAILELNEVYYRYEQDGMDIVRNLNLSLEKGDFLGILGGNGSGKSTTLKLIMGLLNPQRGEIKAQGRLAYLPQNPQSLFSKKTVLEDLFSVFSTKDGKNSEIQEEISRVISLCHLEKLLQQHPFDLSGGEMQRLALGKILLLAPDILLLDEPTKGMDAEFKLEFSEILSALLEEGKSIVMVSHDIEFCAHHCRHCGLFFDGQLLATDRPREFFSDNRFYTTSVNRMAKNLVPKAITIDDLKLALKLESQEIKEKPPEKSFEIALELEKGKEKISKPRLALALVSFLVLAFSFIKALSITELSSLINSSGISSDASSYLLVYVAIFLSLIVFMASIRQKNRKKTYINIEYKKRAISKRTLFASLFILITIPLTIYFGAKFFGNRKYYFIAVLIALQCMLPFFVVFEKRKPKAREIVVIAVLCAIAVAGRAAFFMLPQFKPTLAIVIITAVAFGGETGFLVGALSMFASNMIFGQGPWTPMQMFAAGLIGFLAGLLFNSRLIKPTKLSLAIFGMLSTLVIYGGIMDGIFAILASNEGDLSLILAYFISGFALNLVHALATGLFLYLASQSFLEKLERIKTKYGLIEH